MIGKNLVNEIVGPLEYRRRRAKTLRRRARRVLAVAFVAALVGSCSTDRPTPIPQGEPPAETSTTAIVRPNVDVSMPDSITELAAEEGSELSGAELEEFLARRYEAYRTVYDLAREQPSPEPAADYPELADFLAGDQLASVHDNLVLLYDLGEAFREPESPAVDATDADAEHMISVELVEEGIAELTICLVRDEVHFLVDTGEILNDGVTTSELTATMARNQDGRWKIIRTTPVQIENGLGGCWLEPDRFQY